MVLWSHWTFFCLPLFYLDVLHLSFLSSVIYNMILSCWAAHLYFPAFYNTWLIQLFKVLVNDFSMKQVMTISTFYTSSCWGQKKIIMMIQACPHEQIVFSFLNSKSPLRLQLTVPCKMTPDTYLCQHRYLQNKASFSGVSLGGGRRESRWSCCAVVWRSARLGLCQLSQATQAMLKG